MDISLIIVNYNTNTHLKACLDTFYRFSSNLKFEVIVVDNNSSDRSIEFFPHDYPMASFFFREVNDGFGAGCNYGAKYASGKYLLFVNPDVVFLSNACYDLFMFMENHSNAGLISPIYIKEDGDFDFTDGVFPGYKWEIREAFDDIFSRIYFKIFTRKEHNFENPFAVCWVMGSFMLMKKQIFEDIKGFDEDFFMYYEDIDLQYRIRCLGYKIFYHPKVIVKHLKRSSVRTYGGENLYYYHMTRSNLIYMYKHFSVLKRNTIRVLHLLGILIRLVSLPLRKVYRNKKKQKLLQYILKWKQFVSSRDTIYSNKLLKTVSVADDKSQVTTNDKFWQ